MTRSPRIPLMPPVKARSQLPSSRNQLEAPAAQMQRDLEEIARPHMRFGKYGPHFPHRARQN